MIRAAIYARKSNEEEDDKSKDQASVKRQKDDARAFISEKGWTLDDTRIGTKQVKGPDGKVQDAPVYQHIYEDDGVSGALFAGRPEFQRMLRDAEAGAFDAIVFFDLDRFGRHGHQTMVALHHLADLGIEVWDCEAKTKMDLDSFGGRLTTVLKAEFAQQFREQVRKHTRAAHERLAKQGFVVGGRTFGYTNVLRTPGVKGETIRVPYEPEADVVREIFTRYAAGAGAYAIALALNARNAPTPRAQQGRPSAWSVSTIREVLKRPIYRGVLVWGKTKSAYGRELGKLATRKGRKREKGQLPVPEVDWTRVTDESVRIVSPELAARVDARLCDTRSRYLAAVGAQHGKMPHKSWGKYLLSGGMLLCPTCGGHFEALTSPKSKPVYVCATRRRKPGACTNTLALPMPLADDVVLEMLNVELLSEKWIEELLTVVDQGESDNVAWLTAERDRLRGEVSNLVRSIAKGVSEDTVADDIRKREQKIAHLEVRLRTPKQPPNIARLRDALTRRAAEWKATLRSDTKAARLMVRHLICPLEMDDTRPDFIEAVAEVKPGLMEGLADVHDAASLMQFLGGGSGPTDAYKMWRPHRERDALGQRFRLTRSLRRAA